MALNCSIYFRARIPRLRKISSFPLLYVILLAKHCIHHVVFLGLSFLYGPRFARSVLPPPRANISQCGPRARLVSGYYFFSPKTYLNYAINGRAYQKGLCCLCKLRFNSSSGKHWKGSFGLVRNFNNDTFRTTENRVFDNLGSFYLFCCCCCFFF